MEGQGSQCKKHLPENKRHSISATAGCQMLMIHGRKWPTGYDIPKTGQSGAEGGGGTDNVRGGKVSTHDMCTRSGPWADSKPRCSWRSDVMLRNTLIKACVQADTYLGPLMTPAHSLYKNNKGIRFDPTCKFLLRDIKL